MRSLRRTLERVWNLLITIWAPLPDQLIADLRFVRLPLVASRAEISPLDHPLCKRSKIHPGFFHFGRHFGFIELLPAEAALERLELDLFCAFRALLSQAVEVCLEVDPGRSLRLVLGALDGREECHQHPERS